MNHKKSLSAGLLTLGLLFSTLPVAFATTNTGTAAGNAVESTTNAAGNAATATGNAATNAADTVQNQAQGFNDWGLFGLLGLLGLLGLRGGTNRNVVVDGTRR